MSNEVDPNGYIAHTPGAKMDSGKAPVAQGVLQYFPLALAAVAMVSLAGAKKYAWKGWEHVPDGFNRYSDALGRHLLAEAKDGPIDSDTGCYHAAQVAWNALARLELFLRNEKASPKAGEKIEVDNLDDVVIAARRALGYKNLRDSNPAPTCDDPTASRPIEGGRSSFYLPFEVYVDPQGKQHKNNWGRDNIELVWRKV